MYSNGSGSEVSQSIISICESPLIELVKFENDDAIDFNSSSAKSSSF